MRTRGPAGRLVGALVFALLSGPARGDDAAGEFNPSQNLAGGRWTYGWSASLGSALNLYTVPSADLFLQYWRASPDNFSYVTFNSGSNPRTFGTITFPAYSLNLSPGPTQVAVVRWTAPVAGEVSVAALFLARSTNANAQRVVAVMHGAEVLFSRWLTPGVHGSSASMSATVEVAAGESIDFLVGSADGSYTFDATGLDATVSYDSEPTPLGPVIHFGRDRFVAARWPGDAFDAIAFDPVSRTIAGQGEIQDLCGNFLTNGPPGGQGMAWDPVTQTIWEVTPTRVVRRWNGATLLDTVFTVPLTFMVPGVGLETMESVRGIAVDSNFVYFVDAGPNPGQVASNAWFKFSRAGAPLKSSALTDLHQHLDLDPDALVDDIVYSPHDSPVFPGRLLVALEHSGIQVLDTDGNFVDAFRWSRQSLRPRDAARQFGRLSAFAGIALDPQTGNLYLEDNDTGDAQVWVRLPRGDSTHYVVATGSPQPWLYWPVAGCNMPLWNPVPTPPYEIGLFFGLAYRERARLMYTVDYSGGDLWFVDPRSGTGGRVGPTGVDAIWGLAYDPGRDVIYGRTETGPGNQIVVIDPTTAAASALPADIGFYVTDLAYSTADSALYGVVSGPSRLVRINRETGAGVVVGNTVDARGLDYEPVGNRLIGIADSRLVSIHPATGAAETLSTLVPGPFEGLAVVTVPLDPAVLAVDPPALRITRSLRAWPNPARDAVTVEFELERTDEMAVAVFDVQGRRVRELGRKRFAPGAHRLRWDGTVAGGAGAPAGVYFLRVESASHAAVARVVRTR